MMKPFQHHYNYITISDRDGNEVKRLAYAYNMMGHPNVTNSDKVLFDMDGITYRYNIEKDYLEEINYDVADISTGPVQFGNQLYWLQGNGIWCRGAYTGPGLKHLVEIHNPFGLIVFRRRGRYWLMVNTLSADRLVLLHGWSSTDATQNFIPMENPIMVGLTALNAGQPLSDSKEIYRLYKDLRSDQIIAGQMRFNKYIYQETPKLEIDSDALWISRGLNYAARLYPATTYVWSDRQLFKIWINQKRRRNG